MQWVLRLFVVTVLAVLAPAAAQAPSRVALVIANGAYQSVPALTNPARDGALIVDALRRAGFAVSDLRRDLTKPQFDAALRDFKRQADAADIALVYYAGHGIELEEKNWLLPVDARIADPVDALTEGVALDTVLSYVRGARRVRVVVLDACRNNPFALRLASPTRTLTRGLRPVDGLPAGTVVAYSASFGQEAADGQGAANSPFAAALARRVVEPGLEVRFLFASVHDDVIAANASSPIAAVRSQRPWMGAALSSEQIFFVPPLAQPSIATLIVMGQEVRASDLGAEVEAFDSAAKANSAPVWQDFLRRFPTARLRGVAELSLAKLQQPASGRGADPLAAARRAVDAVTAQEWRAAESSALVARVIAASDRSGLERLAVQGDARAQWLAGRAYYNGLYGFPINKAEAVRLYRLAAARGDARGQNSLGFAYESGEGGLAQDKAEAVRLYRLAAAQGNALGQSNLALMHFDGKGGVVQDKAEAARLFRLAAAQGHAAAQINLGLMYERGDGGLAQDKAEAVRLYRLAAAQGNAAAQTNLAYMYDSGEGVPADRAEAVRLYQLAATQGFARAQANLGIMYEGGEGGLAANRAEAVRLYQLAARQGNAFGIEQLRRLGETW